MGREKDAKSTAEIWKQKGNTAFSSGEYDDAIDAYTRAIKFCPQNDSIYACRCLAFIKVGRFEDALADSNHCITLNNDNPTGYLRKAAVYRARREYEKAIDVYRDGLHIIPRELRLQKGLAAAKRSMAKHGRAAKAMKRSQVARRVSIKSIAMQKKVDKARSVPSYVKDARRELQAKMAEIQSQLDLLDDLATMNDNEKLELLYRIVDVDGDGQGVTARELATALRKYNKNLSFQDSIERAILLVAKFDTSGSARLEMGQFKVCIQVMLKELEVSLTEFTEFLVIRMVLTIQADAEVSDETSVDEIGFLSKAEKQEDFTSMLTDRRMLELFDLFDSEDNGELSFRDVALGLYQLTRSLEDSIKTTTQVLLALDEDDSRTLNCEEFTRLIMAIVATSGSTFDDVADGMIKLLVSQEANVSEDEIATLMLANAIYETASEKKGEQQNLMDALSYGRLRRLFAILDVNHDGGVSTNELVEGIRSLYDATGMVGKESQQDAKALFQFDKNGDKLLQPDEFTEAMICYAKTLRIDLNDLINYMCVTSVSVDDDEARESFRRAFGKSVDSDKSLAGCHIPRTWVWTFTSENTTLLLCFLTSQQKDDPML